MRNNINGTYSSKHADAYIVQELINYDNFPQIKGQHEYLDVDSDIPGTSVELQSVDLGAFSLVGLEFNMETMSGGTINVYGSNSGDNVGTALFTATIAAGTSNVTTTINPFAYRFIVVALSGLSTGKIRNIVITAKR